MNSLSLACFATALTNICVGFFVYFSNKGKPLNKVWLILNLSTVLWSTGLGMMIISQSKNMATIWLRVHYIGAIFTPIAFLHFVYVFLNLENKSRTFIKIIYAIGAILILFLFAGLLVKSPAPKYWFNFYTVQNTYYLLFSVVVALFLVYAHYLLFAAFLLSTGTRRLQILYVFLAAAFGFSGGLTTLFPVYNIPIYPHGMWTVSVYPLIITYAITKKHLMDISVVISKSIAYALTMIILGIGYLLLVIFYKWYVSSRIDSLFILLSIAYGIFVGFSFERFRVFLQTTSDKVFLKGRYGFRDSLTYFVNRLFRVVSLEDLRKVFEDARVEVVELKYLKLVVIGVDDKPKELTDEVMEKITKRKKIVFSYELKEQHKNIAYFVPCLSDDHLLAVIIVGEKLSENSFKEEEIETFRVLAPLVATAISRIKPFEDAIVKYKTEKERADLADKIIDRINNYATLGEIALQAGHEIKNPISAINIHSELLREHIGDKEYLEKYIDLVRRNSEKVEILLQRMKEFVLGKSEEKEFNLVDMLNDKVLFLLNGNLSKKEIKVIKNFPDKIVMLADEQALERALVNIIMNAIDSMDMHGTLTVSASSDEKSAYIVVADTGCGIKEEDLSRIFLPLFTTRSNGTGLGLSIAFRTITVDHNGKLDVESQVGKGTTIKIQLPLKHLQKN